MDPQANILLVEAADTGGGPTWTTGTYDAETDTLFWTTGNPGPDYDGSVRAGANLYTCSVLALDPNTPSTLTADRPFSSVPAAYAATAL